MKCFNSKYIGIVFFVLPIIGNTATLCGAGTIRYITEGYLGFDQTLIVLNATEGSNRMVLNYSIPSSYKFNGLSSNLREAFFNKNNVQIFSNTSYGCNYIDEIRVCTAGGVCS
jgi:hypothetical protein